MTMSTTEQQATRKSRPRELGPAARQQRRAESDHRRSEPKKAEQKQDAPKKPDLWKRMASALPLIFGVGFCVAFFVWVCLQMAGQTLGGPKLLVGIFGGAILGILAAGAGAGFARLSSKND